MHILEEEVIGSWADFVDKANALEGWAFRGQERADWQLYSALSRQLHHFVPDRACWQEREIRAIRVFRRKAHNYLNDLSVLKDDFRCVALMQHHGAPTRLLDFTKSPYVAAFFALENATEDAVIYALNTPVLWNAVTRSHPDLTREVVDPRKKGNYERYFACNQYEMLWMGEPREMDRRLIAQSGTFIVPGVLHKSIEEILLEYASDETLLRKMILPPHIREEGMRALYRMNITYATLLPDLDGLARASAYELEIIWRGIERGATQSDVQLS